jgi:hypothetical protein
MCRQLSPEPASNPQMPYLLQDFCCKLNILPRYWLRLKTHTQGKEHK